jgi:hypothetical protein
MGGLQESQSNSKVDGKKRGVAMRFLKRIDNWNPLRILL